MKFYVIGINDSATPEFSGAVRDVIASHRVFSGGSRHRGIVSPFLPEGYQWIDITVPLAPVFGEYERHDEIVVFASCDPLFFGFAATIQRFMPDAGIEVFPVFHSLQMLAHRILMPYQDMQMVSLTGRSWMKFDEALICGYQKIGILTDTKAHTPDKIAGRMVEYGYTDYTVYVGEHLGGTDEKITVCTVEELAGMDFSSPNNLILIRNKARYRPFGIPESEFHLLDGRDRMITKMPVRLATLHSLDLRYRKVFWDIGFCTGSVSVEAKLQFPHLDIVAFEKRESCEDIIRSNMRKFGTPGILPVTGDFLEADISGYPRPDAVFIGGHGGKIREILDKIAPVMEPGAVVVFNAVSSETRDQFLTALAAAGFRAGESMSIKVNDFNQIEVLQAVKL